MKINKRRIPELIAGVLLLSIFFVPCAGVHAEDFSEEKIKEAGIEARFINDNLEDCYQRIRYEIRALLAD